ncbi:heat shock factor-binding protein 1-like protein 1 [Takifugu rubripes]|uniref:heat shock factor-binding protein 1-like protein 1 n=1 Tax=Takifugu rubripes TaxID=31033 RepID=UPI00114603C9|nr:heat shock factor-binding protein 1-like [Takifugu rubripes]
MMTENQRVAEETMSKTDNNSAADMTEAMDKTMQRIQERFREMSQQLENKIEEMGTRIDDLEKNVVELMLQAGMKEQEIAKQ